MENGQLSQWRIENGKRRAYWALVESYRTERGPRRRAVAYLGQLDEAGRLGVRNAATGESERQARLFDDVEPRWTEVDVSRVLVENVREFGGPWLALELSRRLGLIEFMEKTMPSGRERIPWAAMALILVVSRLCDPSSELRIADSRSVSNAG